MAASSVTTDAVLLYVTAADEAEAGRIARALVERRLVACANILPPVRSIYRWEGRIQDEQEVVFVAKTTRARVAAAIACIRELHSYSVPAILALPIVDGDAEYLAWAAAECRAQS